MRIIFLLVLSLYSIVATGQSHTISGYVSDQLTGEKLIGAHIYNANTGIGVTTNAFGFYSFNFQARDTLKLVYSYMGYQKKQLDLDGSFSQIINIELVGGLNIDEVVVKSNVAGDLHNPDKVRLSSRQVKQLPSLGGEFDIMKAMQLMPGVQSGNEGNSGLYVRGGGPDQNLVLVDDVPLYYVNHLAGFISTFNADAINDITLIKGGFPARYGGRLSSILDIRLKDGNLNEFQGSGTIGLVSSKLTFEGPIKKDTSSFIISGRRLLYDLLMRPITKWANSGNSFGYTFYDLNIKVNQRLSENDKLLFSWYSGDDKSVNVQTDARSKDSHMKNNLIIGNMLGSLRWNHNYNQKLFSNFTASFTRFRFITRVKQDIRDGDELLEINNSFKSQIRDISAKLDFEYSPSFWYKSEFGLGSTLHSFSPWTNTYNTMVNSITEVDTTFGSINLNTSEHFAYLDNQFKISDFLTINLGGRYSIYGNAEYWYSRFEPRISMRVMPYKTLSIYGSYTEMQQYVHLLSSSTAGLPIDLWMPSTGNIEPAVAQQYGFGFNKTFSQKEYEASFELFYKKMKDLISYSPGASIIGSTLDWQNLVETGGLGDSYGIELLFRKNYDLLTGWIGYTWSKSTRQFSNINNGQRYPYKFDRRHDISFVIIRTFRDRFDLSATWVYGTGNAFTAPVGKYEAIRDNPQFIDGEPARSMYPIYLHESKNASRMRSYHRLDIGVNIRTTTRWGEGTWSFSIYNLYNRKNPYYYFIRRDGLTKKTELVQQSLFPIIPSISYSFKF